MKILLCSDIHLSLKTWKYKNIFGDSYYALYQICNIAKQKQVNVIIIAGDLFNSIRPSSMDLSIGIELFNAIKDIPVYTIHGEHDLCSPSWHNLLGPNIYPYYDGILELDNIKFAMISKTNPDNFYKLVNETYRECPVIICHQLFKDIFPIAGNIELGKLRPAFYITGDLHEYHYKESFPVSDYRLLCIGGTHYRKISEIQKKFYVHILDTKTMDLEHIELKIRPIHILNYAKNFTEHLSIYDDLYKKLSDISSQTSESVPICGQIFELRPIVVVRYHKDFQIDSEALQRDFRHIIFMFDMYSDEVDFNLGYIDSLDEFNELDCLQEVCPKDNELYPFIKDLLAKNKSVDDIVNQLCDKYKIKI